MPREPKSPAVPEEQLAQATALWQIALRYVALTAAASALPGGVAVTGAGAATFAMTGYAFAKKLAHSYYRLMRAIYTGATLASSGDSGEPASLRELYGDFEKLAYQAVPRRRRADVARRVELASTDPEGAMADLAGEEDLGSLAADADDPDIKAHVNDIENEVSNAFKSLERMWDDERRIALEELDDAERALEETRKAEAEEKKQLLLDLAKIARAEKLDAYRERKKLDSMRVSDKYAEKNRAKARAKRTGQRAGTLAKAVQAGARNEIARLTLVDNRAIGYVRQTHSANPCPFCLVLASRGILLYKSEASASSAWHTNCQCSSEPVFSRDQYFTDSKFAQNRALHMLWREHGGSGKEGWASWRKFWRTTTGAGLAPEERLSAGSKYKTLTEVISDNGVKHPIPIGRKKRRLSQEDKAA